MKIPFLPSCGNGKSAAGAPTENQLPELLWPVILMIGWFQGHQAYTFLPHILPKTFSCIAFIAQYRKAKVVFCKVPQTLPVINGSRSDLKSSDITFYCNKGMHFKAKIGFLFGWTSSIICTVLPPPGKNDNNVRVRICRPQEENCQLQNSG